MTLIQKAAVRFVLNNSVRVEIKKLMAIIYLQKLRAIYK